MPGGVESSLSESFAARDQEHVGGFTLCDLRDLGSAVLARHGIPRVQSKCRSAAGAVAA